MADVVAQLVRTSWTKKSRGGPAAARRNAAPTGFRLPSTRVPLTHTVTMPEWRDFEPEESLDYMEPGKDIVLLTETEGRLRVQLAVTPAGMPHRWRRPPAVWLARGEWLRWQVNYRFSGDGAWNYRLDTLNLAYGPVEAGTFTGIPPRFIDERARLR